MFRVKKSIPVEADLQGYIYFASRMYRKLGNKEQQMVLRICRETGGDYYKALFEFVTTDAGFVTVCRKHYISQSTLERMVRRYYVAFAQEVRQKISEMPKEGGAADGHVCLYDKGW